MPVIEAIGPPKTKSIHQRILKSRRDDRAWQPAGAPKTKSIHQRILKLAGGAGTDAATDGPKNQVDPSADTEITLSSLHRTPTGLPKNQVDPSADTEIGWRADLEKAAQPPPKTKSIHQRILKFADGRRLVRRLVPQKPSRSISGY